MGFLPLIISFIQSFHIHWRFRRDLNQHFQTSIDQYWSMNSYSLEASSSHFVVDKESVCRYITYCLFRPLQLLGPGFFCATLVPIAPACSFASALACDTHQISLPLPISTQKTCRASDLVFFSCFLYFQNFSLPNDVGERNEVGFCFNSNSCTWVKTNLDLKRIIQRTILPNPAYGSLHSVDRYMYI